MNTNGMDDPRVFEKLRKLLALVNQGVGGEKSNAESALRKLLAKHGLTIEDLDDRAAERRLFWWAPKNDFEARLLSQCVATALPDWDGTGYRERGKRSRRRGYEMTHAAWLEVDLMFTVHRQALAEHMKKQHELAFVAYINANELFGHPPAKKDPSKSPAMDPADIDAIVGMMMRMRRTPVHKALGQSGGIHNG